MRFVPMSTLLIATSLLSLNLGCASNQRGLAEGHNALSEDQSSTVYVSVELTGPCAFATDRAYFAFDSDRLTESAKNNLDTLASCLTVGALEDQRILIEGFTDARGSKTYNKELGYDRARSVADYLATKGVDGSRVDIESRGETAVSTVDAGGMVLDRRVEISLSNQLGGFAQWDRNRNDSVDPGELTLGLASAGTFVYWDADEDGELDLDEFNDGVFLGWDRDRDGQIDQKEWYRGAVAWYPAGATYGDWATWDVNGDGVIDSNESRYGIEYTGLYTHWNRDGAAGIVPSDYAEGAYWLLDNDDNGQVDKIEFYEVRNAGWYWYRPTDDLMDGAAEMERY